VPDDADEEELANWNYARELERQVRELKAEHKDALKDLVRLERAAARGRATDADRRAAAEAKSALQPVFDRLASIETELDPYECIKVQLAEARARYRELTDAFVDELKTRCAVMSKDEKRALVLALFAQDVQAELDAAFAERLQELVRFVEGLWDKYRVTLTDHRSERADLEAQLQRFLQELSYA
jgi:type I restriction enzyme M protein